MTADVGLDQMEQQRQRVRRQPLPPRHPKPAAETGGKRSVGGEKPESQQRLPKVAGGQPSATDTAGGTGTEWVPVESTGELRATPIRFDARARHYLREQGADSKLRGLNVSASAVVRLAMSRLISELSPQQVNDLLANAAGARAGAGRKRR